MYPTSSIYVNSRWRQSKATGIAIALLLIFAYGTVTFLSPRIILPMNYDPFSGTIQFLFRAFYLLGAVSALTSAILIFMKVRLRWIGLFALAALLGSGICFYRVTPVTFMTGVVLIYMKQNRLFESAILPTLSS